MARTETPITQAELNAMKDEYHRKTQEYEKQQTRSKIVVGGYVINKCKRDTNFAKEVYKDIKQDVKKAADLKTVKEFIEILEGLLNVPANERIFAEKAKKENENKAVNSNSMITENVTNGSMTIQQPIQAVLNNNQH